MRCVMVRFTMTVAAIVYVDVLSIPKTNLVWTTNCERVIVVVKTIARNKRLNIGNAR